jgi:hypothetical protein
MARDKQHNPDPNANAARIVSESMIPSERPPAELEAAWLAWSASIQRVALTVLDLVKMIEDEERKLGERLTSYLPSPKG